MQAVSASRRRFLSAAVALGAAPAGWARALQPGAVVGASPYGALGGADELGLRLPAGFSARCVAVSGQAVGGHVWHHAPDGGACFATPAGGWVYVSNAELPDGGVGAIRFAADGGIEAAYSILAGTRFNCAGGPTPWGSWLSCEEHARGLVWECDPQGPGMGLARPGLGMFRHEAAAVDPATGTVYLTEDDGLASRFYRFRSKRSGDLSSGVLEVAGVGADGSVAWRRAPTAKPDRSADSTAFARGEGAWCADGTVYFCTTADDRVWALDLASQRLAVIYDAAALGADAPLHAPDNVTVHAPSGDVFVAEDPDDLQLVLLAGSDGERIAAPFLQLVGHDGSEITGPAFSPDGMRLYFSSQRGAGGTGMTFEVSGPFRRARAGQG